MSFYRTPSPLEFSYIATDLPGYSPLVNQFFVIGDGTINTEQFQSALNQAADANPAFKMQLKGFWAWRYWDDNGPYPLLQVIDAPEWDSASSEGAPCLGDPIDLRKDPCTQVSIIHAKNGTHILFRTHHAISDGRGTVHFINDAFRIMRGEAPIGSHSKLTEWEIAMREERPQRNIVEGDCLPVMEGTSSPEQRGYQWFRFDWNGNYNKLAAKFIFAGSKLAHDHFGQGKIRFRVPADLRRYLKEDEGFTTANCSGAIDLEITPDLKVNQIRSLLVKAMRNKDDLSPFQENHKYARWLPRSMFRSHPKTLQTAHENKRYRMTGIISYMGEVNNDAFQFEGFTPTSQFGVPIPFENRPIFMAACSYNGITNIIIGCPKAVATMEELKAFCDLLSTTLDEL